MEGSPNPEISNRVRQITARRRPKSVLLVALLAFALVLTGVLGWQALDAERSHRAAAERALKDYARFAAWQQAGQEMLGAMISTFILPLTRVQPDKPEEWPSPEEFRAASLQPPAPAKYLEGTRFFFRFSWRDSSMTLAGETPSPAVLKWVSPLA